MNKTVDFHGFGILCFIDFFFFKQVCFSIWWNFLDFFQLWNPYKPLPPPPRSYSPDPRSGSSSSPSPNQRVSPIPQPSATLITPPPEADPYSSLSAEAQGFVNTLTSMGFSRSRAARAVQKFGADEKEVSVRLFVNHQAVLQSFFSFLMRCVSAHAGLLHE